MYSVVANNCLYLFFFFKKLDLKLSVSLLGTNTSVQIVASADISQGFSFQKQIGGATVYEHHYNVLFFFFFFFYLVDFEK
jgi:hypothetical protein